jgi:16S rRNA (adenine1518-N6/adenine1519-N6)-dimethyltransferase
MSRVSPKKSLGQHFLKDNVVAERIASTLTGKGYDSVLEIGPGTGVLTDFLIQKNYSDFRVIEIDNESVYFLKERYKSGVEIIRGDFLVMDIESEFNGKLAVIGNFPYNISTQILFKVLKSKEKVSEVCGMFQKEVAERICAPPGSRTYGILSVLIQAFYDAEYLFSVPPSAFIPPPKVTSGVLRLKRNEVTSLACDEILFTKVVKAAFNQRRKTLRNSVRSAFSLKNEDYPDFGLRPEQLSVADFIRLTNWITENKI